MSITSRAPRRISFEQHSTPAVIGPGTYESIGSLKALPDQPYPFLTTAARMTDSDNGVPGPSDYHPNIPKLHIHGGIATMQSVTPRQSWQIIESPSPVEHGNINEWGRSSQRRPRQPMSSRSPKGWTVKTEWNATCADFDLRPKMERGRSVPKSARNFNWDKNKTPGPGAYSPDVSKKPKPPLYCFMSDAERKVFPQNDWTVDSPGVGQEEWARPKGFAPFGKKARSKNIWGVMPKTPGPGAYTLRSESTPKRNDAAFGVKGPRNIYHPNENPGPADYNVGRRMRIQSDRSKPFSQRAPRFNKVVQATDLGPGQYETDTEDKVRKTKVLDKSSPAFLCTNDRNPFPVDTDVPGPAKYSPEKGEAKQEERKLKRCIDGTNRYQKGTFIGQPIPDNPSPAMYSPRSDGCKKRTNVGGYIPHTERSSIGGPTLAPAPCTYNTGSDMLKPSLNVTYSVGKNIY